jgi:hypothetical protein
VKKIAIIGKGDKRLFVYPLLHACKKAVHTCVITDDISYKRLYNGYENTEQVHGRLEINVIPPSTSQPDETQLAFLRGLSDAKKQEGFDLIIYVIEGYIPEGCDKVLGIITQTHSFLGWELDYVQESYPGITFAMMTMYYTPKMQATKVHAFPWKNRHFLYLSRVEEFKMLHGIKDAKLNDFLAEQFHKELDLEKTEMLKCLKNTKLSLS